MKFRVDAVTTPSFDNGKTPGICVLFDDFSKFPNRGSGLDDCNGHVQGFPRCFNESDRIWVCFGLVTYVVGFVQIGMVSAVVDGDIQIENIAIKKDSLVGDAMAYNFIWGCTQ